MLYVSLGNSGLKVSKLILGCMTYGDPAWSDPSWVLGEQESINHIKFAFENGINTFDTADVYCGGASEVILGKALKTLGVPREDYVVMTKVFFPVTPKMPKNFMAPEFKNKRGLSRKHIFDAVRGSLERLQLDYVDVLQCHRFDNETPIEETMKALHDVVKAGYARYIGMSACYGYQYYAITHNLTPFISMQNQYNLVYREEEREMFPILKHFGVGSIPYAPLAAGYLTRPIEEGKSTFRATNDKFGLARYEGLGAQELINKKVQEIASKKGISMAQVALAWLLQKKGVTAPIVGTTSTEKMKDLISALDVQLDAEEVKSLEELYVPRPLNGLL